MDQNETLDENLTVTRESKSFKYPRKVKWFWNIYFLLHITILMLGGITHGLFLINLIVCGIFTYRISALNKKDSLAWARIYLLTLSVYVLGKSIVSVIYLLQMTKTNPEFLRLMIIGHLRFPVLLLFLVTGCIFHFQFGRKSRYRG